MGPGAYQHLKSGEGIKAFKPLDLDENEGEN